MSSYDLIVVGAGPAGSMAALTAQRRGLKTLLVEREEVVGGNVICGEGVSSAIFDDMIQSRPEWISSTVDRVVFRLADFREFSVNTPGIGLVLDRKVFDRDLSKMASDEGARLLTGAVAKSPLREGDRMIGLVVESDGVEKHYYARAFVGADGMASLVGRWAGLNTALQTQDVVSCAQCLISSTHIDDHVVEFVVGSQIAPGGYAWVFSKGRHLANVGLGITPGVHGKKASDLLETFLARRFTDASVLDRKCGGFSGRFTGEIARGNVVLCGDAARVGDPLSGGGIYNAILSGMIAGNTAAQTDPTLFAERYEESLQRKIGRDTRFSEELRRIYLRMKDEQLEELWEFVRRKYGGKTVTSVHPAGIIASFVWRHPRYLKYIPAIVKSVL